MKLKLVLASLLAFFALADGAQAAVLPPQPLAPAIGSVIYDATVTGATLEISTPSGTSKPVFVEVSQYPATNAEGQFVDPLAIHLGGEYTHNPAVEIAHISPYSFSTLESTKPVYWHASVIECVTLEDCHQVGATWSFSFTTTPQPSPTPVSPSHGSTGSSACRSASEARSAARRRYVAAKRATTAGGGHTPAMNKRLDHRKALARKALERAEARVLNAC